MQIKALSALCLAAACAVSAEPESRRSLSGLFKRGLISDLLSGLLSGSSGQPAEKCPAVWYNISQALTPLFVENGQCGFRARASIRIAFHDCFSWSEKNPVGGCDGSLFYGNEFTRPENAGLNPAVPTLASFYQRFGVSIADGMQFGAAHAIATCGGPRIKTYVGRSDNKLTPSPEGLLPDVNANALVLYRQFADRGFDAKDLAALIGAHTVARQQFVDTARANASSDSTPGVWDTKFYKETFDGSAPFTFASDRALSRFLLVSVWMKTFQISLNAFNSAFSDAMTKMSLLGVDTTNLIDCTDALPGANAKRGRF